MACSVVAQAGSNCHLAAQAIAAALISCKGPFLACVLACPLPALAWLHSELMGVKWHPVAVLASNFGAAEEGEGVFVAAAGPFWRSQAGGRGLVEQDRVCHGCCKCISPCCQLFISA